MKTPESSELFEGYEVSFQRIAIFDDQSFQGGKFVGKEFPLEVKLKIHPSDNGTIVVNYPGANGNIDGYNNKFGTLGNYLQATIGAVIRTGNTQYGGFKYDVSVRGHLKAVIDYALQNAEKISGVNAENAVIYLMGFSAGASAVAAVAHEYPQVKKILLIAPSGEAGEEAVTNGLNRYTGECHILVGNNDEVVGNQAGTFFASLATAASVVRNVVISDCDHQFRGERNGRIMSVATLWAFANTKIMLDPNMGVKLYD